MGCALARSVRDITFFPSIRSDGTLFQIRAPQGGMDTGGGGVWSAPLPPTCTSIFFFGEPLQGPKWCFFNPVSILGLKKNTILGLRPAPGKKNIEAQDKKRAHKGGTPLLGDFWQFWPFWVKFGAKAVYYSGQHWNARY